MIHSLRAVSLCVLLSLVITGVSIAGPPLLTNACEEGSPHGYFSLATEDWGGPCAVYFGPSPVVAVKVLLNSVPATKARFSLPDPPYGTVIGETWNFPASGDRLTGLELDLGACPEGALLGTLTVLVDEPVVDCTPWQINEDCEIVVCDGSVRPALAKDQMVTTVSGGPYCGCCWQCCEGLPVYGLYPADGAADVPTNVTLSWSGGPFVLPGDEPYFYCAVVLGTDPDCATGETFVIPCNVDAFAPEGLQPFTTYYWHVSWSQTTGSGCSSGYWGVTATYSFTTGDPVAVESTTWGRVKSLYRN